MSIECNCCDVDAQTDPLNAATLTCCSQALAGDIDTMQSPSLRMVDRCKSIATKRRVDKLVERSVVPRVSFAVKQ
jgi:hypothetical protein